MVIMVYELNESIVYHATILMVSSTLRLSHLADSKLKSSTKMKLGIRRWLHTLSSLSEVWAQIHTGTNGRQPTFFSCW